MEIATQRKTNTDIKGLTCIVVQNIVEFLEAFHNHRRVERGWRPAQHFIKRGGAETILIPADTNKDVSQNIKRPCYSWVNTICK